MITFKEYLAEIAIKGKKVAKGKPHWDDLTKEEQSKYLVNQNIKISNSMIIDGEFPIIFPDKWDYGFYCIDCVSLKTLYGAPKIVKAHFNCKGCTSLKTLEWAPLSVGKGFECSDCTSLTSLQGSPTKLSGSFYCLRCVSLKTLEGAPSKVTGDFSCTECYSLKETGLSLKQVSGVFYFMNTKLSNEKIEKNIVVKKKITDGYF